MTESIMQMSSEAYHYVVSESEYMGCYYYYQAVEDVNNSDLVLRPSEWRELVKVHEEFITAVDKLSQYIYYGDNEAYESFFEACNNYLDY